MYTLGSWATCRVDTSDCEWLDITFRALYGLRGGNVPWLICWFSHYVNCLFVYLTLEIIPEPFLVLFRPGTTSVLSGRQRCADPEMLRPHHSADSDHRSATASAGRCCLGSAVSPRVRDSLSDSDPCLHLTNRPNGLSTLRRVLRRVCRGHKSKVMLPTAVNRSRQKQQSKYMNNQ